MLSVLLVNFWDLIQYRKKGRICGSEILNSSTPGHIRGKDDETSTSRVSRLTGDMRSVGVVEK